MYTTLVLFIFLSASFGQDVLPPDNQFTTTVASDNLSTTEHSWIIPLECPTNCTCTLLDSEHNCGKIGGYHSHHRVNNGFRHRRNIKIGRCLSEYNYHRGKCVNIRDHVLITCPFPQKELMCCKLNGPEECRDTKRKLDCTHETYTYCGHLCEKGKNVTEVEILTVLERNLRQKFLGNYL